jgi:hypothetical protein
MAILVVVAAVLLQLRRRRAGVIVGSVTSRKPRRSPAKKRGRT